MSGQITEIRFGKREHPYLFLSQEEVARIKELVKEEGSYQQVRFVEIKEAADAWMAKPLAL